MNPRPPGPGERDLPRLAVVVIGLGAPPMLVEAVRSILEQGVAAELVVVNSGGGGAAALLARAGIDVPVHETAPRLYAGAARNIGIRATRAPYVAFLADDCLAAPGWVAERLRLHAAGMPMVASAVRPDRDDRLAWAHQLLLFPRRLPGLPEGEALRYGVSFDRRLFDRHGLFDPDLPTGEDTEFLARLDHRPAWAPSVVTLHRNAASLPALLRDQFRRGRRYAASMAALRGSGRLRILRETLRLPRHARRLAALGLAGADLAQARSALPLVRLGTLAKAAGVLAAPRASRRAKPARARPAPGDRPAGR